MFSLLKSLFGSEPVEKGRYAETVVQEGMRLALEASDARIRGLSGYQDKLRPCMLKTFDHVVELVDGLPGELELSRESFSREANLAAFFASVDHMQQVLRDDTDLTDFIDSAEGRRSGAAHGLLVMQRVERNVLGMELQGDIMRRDVAQVAVNFTAHRLLAVAGDAEQARRLMYRRAFNHILEAALERIVGERGERADLKRQRRLLQEKLECLKQGCWGLESREGRPASAQQIEQAIDKLDRELIHLGADGDLLHRHLDILCDVLDQPAELIGGRDVELSVDRSGIKRDAPEAGSLDLKLKEVYNWRGRQVIVQPVFLSRMDFPQRGDFLAEASRFLGA